MDIITKENILRKCNTIQFPVDELYKFVKDGHITIEELKNANLELAKVKFLISQQQRDSEIKINKELPVKLGDEDEDEDKKNQDPLIEPLDTKTKAIDEVLKNKVSATEILGNIEDSIYAYEDLLTAGLARKTVQAIKNWDSSTQPKKLTVQDLPVMPAERTDVFFVGLGASGKTVMLSGIMKFCESKGILFNGSNNDGNVYKDQLIRAIDMGYLPKSTANEYYNYVETKLKDSHGHQHPLNIVEVPGENYRRIYENGISSSEVSGFITHVQNNNRKILIFVLDGAVQENKLSGEAYDYINQNAIYSNILSMFNNNKILEKTDAIYLIVNKFDVLKDGPYSNKNVDDRVLADEYIKEHFLNLLNNCIELKNTTKNKFNIKVLPFSIGKVTYKHVLEEYDPKYSDLLVHEILVDSFVIKGRKTNMWTKLGF